MTEFDKNSIAELNDILSDALDANNEINYYITASKVVKFWSKFLYEDSGLEDAKCKLLEELEKDEPVGLFKALAVYRLVNSDFWNGDTTNLGRIPPQYKSQILAAAKSIHKTSEADAIFFGASS